jgi:hypothetical protein
VDVMYSLDNLEAATLSLFGMGVYTTWKVHSPV